MRNLTGTWEALLAGMLLGAMLAGCATPHRKDSPNWLRCKATCAKDGV